jgi:hypothetical protein
MLVVGSVEPVLVREQLAPVGARQRTERVVLALGSWRMVTWVDLVASRGRGTAQGTGAGDFEHQGGRRFIR